PPALPVSKTPTATTGAPASSTTRATTAGGAPTSTLTPTSTTTPRGPGIAMTGPAGTGTLTWSVDASREEFCYHITIRGAGNATSAHLRHADSNDVVLTLVAPG